MSESSTTSNTVSFPALEEAVLRFWEERDIFRQSLRQTEDGESYVFYDGPPFATGLPHHGHLLISVIKDVVPRYWTMKGRHVERRFGWDCHGLPIEHEIDQTLGMSAQQAVQTMGVAGYNAQCRSIVERYVKEWRQTITRIGRWVDFDNDYKTMEVWYMESVWWALKQLWDKGLIYRGIKVMPVSTALETPLSNFEAGQNYQDVQDPSITVLFRLKDEDAYMSAWTTTPWTLPSNLALCVGADIEYVRVRDLDSGNRIYLAKARVPHYSQRYSLEIETSVRGSDLVGRKYDPLFPFFAEHEDNGAFVILADDYVSTDEGTGIVHQAPAFGEDDYRIAQANGLSSVVCPVTMHGVFTKEVGDFAGKFVKDADHDIIDQLKSSGNLFEQDTIQHSYPYCYRSDTPLIYRAVPTWFVAVSEFRDRLVETNQEIRWVPEHVRDGRFGDWLRNAIDWAISRSRVWGTPLPIWENKQSGKFVCIGSVEELEQRTGVRVDDLHREHVDHLTFSVDGEEGVYRRVEEVLDCWFESGSMPYAQLHYPFENQDAFATGFPAQFIVEALDQTRGWFYTLMALAVAMFDKPAFRNVIVAGLVLAEDGKKMSKSLRNFTPPDDLMDEYGADALRLYLINSGLVKGEEQRFTDKGVREMVRRALLPWYNAFSFLDLYAGIDDWSPTEVELESDNILDQWIISRLQTLKSSIAREMERYRLYNVVPQLFEFVEDLSRWYIRFNRSRFWGEGLTADKHAAYSTLYTAVRELTLAMAPCAPFLAEHIYRKLCGSERSDTESVHLAEYPVAQIELQKPILEAAVERMKQVILLGRRRREDTRTNLRTPLPRLVIVHRDTALLDELRALEPYVKAELNVKRVDYESAEDRYISLYAKPNFPVLGKRLGRRMKEFKSLIESMDADAIDQLQNDGEFSLNGETFTTDEIQVFRETKPDSSTATNRLISIDLDCTVPDELRLEGWAREVVHRIQQARRERGFEVADRIDVVYEASPRLQTALFNHSQYVTGETLAIQFEPGGASEFLFEFEGERICFDLAKHS